MDGQCSNRLGGVHTEQKSMVPNDLSQLGNGLDGSRHIRGVGNDQQAGLRPNRGVDILGVQPAVAGAGNNRYLLLKEYRIPLAIPISLRTI